MEYDSSGNWINICNDTTFAWTMGRQLASVNGGEAIYTYNEDGIRTSKYYNGVTTKYYLDGTNIIYQTDGTDELYFFYDKNDELIGFNYENSNYFYIKNGLGVITDIADSSGNIVTSYEYDPWGDVLEMYGNTSLGRINPFRYKSYYYDSEVGWYYLQSRYYYPMMCRFINCDDVNYIGVTESEISYNPFAYCLNNAVNNADSDGFIPYKVWQAILGGIMGGITQYLTDLISVKWLKGRYSSVATYALAVLGGVWDGISNGGFMKGLAVAIGKNLLSQLIRSVYKELHADRETGC